MDSPFEGYLLLVGEGDFSLSVSIVSLLPSSARPRVISTSLETEVTILKHQSAQQNITWLSDNGVTVHLNTDATQLHLNEKLNEHRYERIIFNFPHAGGKSNHKKNRKLLNDFFCSAAKVLGTDGEILVSLCKGQGGTPADNPRRKWHDSWQVVSMAANAGLILKKVTPFVAEKFMQYTSTGFRSQDKGFNTEGALTHIFVKSPHVSLLDFEDKVFHSTLCPNNEYIQQKLKRNLHREKNNPIGHLREMLEKALSSKFHFSTLCCVHPVINVQSGINTMEINNTLCTCDSNMGYKTSDEGVTTTESLPSVLGTSSLLSCIPECFYAQQNTLGTVQVVEDCMIKEDTLPVLHYFTGCLPTISTCSSVKSNESSEDSEIVLHIVDQISNTVNEVSHKEIQIFVSDKKEINLTHLSQNDAGQSEHHKIGMTFSLERDSKYTLFSVNLDKLAVLIYKLPNIRILWSDMDIVCNSYKEIISSKRTFETISLYPMMFVHDMSFWENEKQPFCEDDFLSVIRSVCDDIVVNVDLIDTFYSSDMNAKSRCYRLNFQSYDKSLSYDISWKMQSQVRLSVEKALQIRLR